jgi:hypothetical protein
MFTKIVGIRDSGPENIYPGSRVQKCTESRIRNTVYTQLRYLNRSLHTIWYGTVFGILGRFPHVTVL